MNTLRDVKSIELASNTLVTEYGSPKDSYKIGKEHLASSAREKLNQIYKKNHTKQDLNFIQLNLIKV